MLFIELTPIGLRPHIINKHLINIWFLVMFSAVSQTAIATSLESRTTSILSISHAGTTQSSRNEQSTDNTLSQATELQFATSSLTPWNYHEDNKIRGIEHEIILAICQRIRLKLSTVFVPDRRSVLFLRDGRADLTTVSMHLNDSLTNEDVLTDSQHLYLFMISVMTLNSSDIEVTSINDIYQYRVGHLRLAKYLEEKVLPAHPKRLRFNHNSSLLKGLLSRRVDVIYGAAAELWFPAKQLKVENRIKLIHNEFSLASVPVWSKRGIATTQPNIREQFSKAVKSLRQEGIIAKILQRHSRLEFFSDYGAPPPLSAKEPLLKISTP